MKQPHFPFSALLTLFLGLGLSSQLLAHPTPEIPIKAYFAPDGSVQFKTEIDPRSWAESPYDAPYLTHEEFKALSDAEKQEMIDKAAALVADSVQFFWDPTGEFFPEFSWEFGGMSGMPLELDEDPVMISGSWNTKVSQETAEYFIKATRGQRLSVQFLNHFGPVPLDRIMVLFPGETSFKLDITNLPEKVKKAKKAAEAHEVVGT